jgi:hypothetical protein
MSLKENASYREGVYEIWGQSFDADLRTKNKDIEELASKVTIEDMQNLMQLT